MKKVLYSILGIIVLIVALLLLFFKFDSSNPYQKTTWGKFSAECDVNDAPSEKFGEDFHGCDFSVPESEIPTFKKAEFNFSNKFDNKKSLPLMASAMIDIDNDGVDEVFVGGGVTQEDAIFKYGDGEFSDISDSYTLPKKPSATTTYGAASFDLDNDGMTDLLLTGDYGLLWYKNTGSAFESTKIDVPFDDKSVPASVTIGDINRDGHPDIFVSNYIKLDKMEGQTIFKDFEYGSSSLLMMNKGDNTFEDATARYGLSYIHNTFMGIFVDIDNDGFLDLVVAHDTGEVRTYKNEGGQKFTKKSNPTTGKYAYPMGIAVGDYNNDGNMDFFFSNTGSSVPEFLARGDLAEEDIFIKDWMLFRNDGDFNFTDVAKETKVADFEFSWGAIFEDFNLDGRQDLVVAENYVDFPPHKLFKLPGRFLLQRENGTFAAVEKQANAINMNYAITPLSSDFNQDGYPDLFFANLDGTVKVHINEGGDANYIAVRLPENVKYVGAAVTVTKIDGSTLTDAYVIGEGLASDQTSTLTFGLGADTEITSVNIALPDGTTQAIVNPKVNAVNTL
jgi:hypothetical protein